VGDVPCELVPQFRRVGGGEIDFVLGAVDGEPDGFLGFFTGKVVDQLDKYFSSHGVLFLFRFCVRPPNEPIV
jgi:hypothetical protein